MYHTLKEEDIKEIYKHYLIGKIFLHNSSFNIPYIYLSIQEIHDIIFLLNKKYFSYRTSPNIIDTKFIAAILNKYDTLKNILYLLNSADDDNTSNIIKIRTYKFDTEFIKSINNIFDFELLGNSSDFYQILLSGKENLKIYTNKMGVMPVLHKLIYTNSIETDIDYLFIFDKLTVPITISQIPVQIKFIIHCIETHVKIADRDLQNLYDIYKFLNLSSLPSLCELITHIYNNHMINIYHIDHLILDIGINNKKELINQGFIDTLDKDINALSEELIGINEKIFMTHKIMQMFI
jgi:hypothetical protein